MADAAVEFLLQNLTELLLYNLELISGVDDQVKLLHTDLTLFKSFLKEYSAKRIKNEVLQAYVNEIRDVVYEAEDTLDTFVTHAAVQKARSFLKKTFHITDHASELRRVAKQIETIRSKVKNIYDKKEFGFDALQTHLEGSNRAPREKMEPTVEEDNVVGFQDEAQNVINLLTGGSEELEVISVVGMPGLGKTTLAKMIFRHLAIEHEFYNRGWVYVSYEYSRKEVFLNILRQFTRPNDDMYKMNDTELANEIRTVLGQGKYFIVLDDVWTKETWDHIKIAFPNSKNRSRILLTSRESVVARHANPNIDPYQLRFLKDDESWELLRRKALGSKECPEELRSYGLNIVKECKGLPLALVVIGGVLLEKGNESDWWQKVSQSVDAYIKEDPGKTMESFIEMSFNHLPYHLKACFLYFGMFPEDYQISVWKLVHLWIAEGFIQENDEISMEDRADGYLDDLVSRNLIMVGERRSNGKIKTCHVHDMLHVFCKNQAAKENFFHEIKQFDPNTYLSSHPNLTNYRRLCIHSRILSYVSSKPAGPRIRSFLCFTSDETDVPLDKSLSVPGAFKLIRVFEGKPIRFLRFPTNLSELIHLRYLVLSIHFKILPQEISKLWNLQTLIVETSSRTLEINEDIWKVRRLRHLKTNTGTSTTILSKRSKGGEETSQNGNLLTLSTISPESCMAQNVLSRAPNLKKLGVRGPLANLLSSFDTVGKLNNLENLKLLNDVHPKPHTEAKIFRFPQKYQFPPKLKKLTLENTRLDWRHMSTLGILDSLEIVKLKDNAFEGHEWNAVDGGFLNLKLLKIGKTDLVSWKASAHHFPRLKSLYVRECTKLFEIPLGLADVLSLQIIDLYYTTNSAVASARKIQQHKIRAQDQKTNKGRGFRLSISPPDQDQ